MLFTYNLIFILRKNDKFDDIQFNSFFKFF